MKALNLAVRFVLELCMLAALAVVGWQAAGPWTLGLAFALGLPALVATAWGMWVAPKAKHRLADPARFAVEAALFAVASAGLALTGHGVWAVALAAVYSVNVSLGFAWHQREH